LRLQRGVLEAGYTIDDFWNMTPRECNLVILAHQKSEHEAWRRAAMVTATLRRVFGDKKVTINDIVPEWREMFLPPEKIKKERTDAAYRRVAYRERRAAYQLLKRRMREKREANG